MERIQWTLKQSLWLLRLVLLILIYVAGHIDNWKYDFTRVWSLLSSSRLFLYPALATVTLAGMAVALAYRRSRGRKRWSWLFQRVVLLVFVESFVKGLIDLFSEVRTSRLSLGLALAGMALLILAAVLEYRRQKQRERAGQNFPKQPIHEDRDGLTADHYFIE